MFVGDEVLLNAGFADARAGLTRLTRGRQLLSASDDAYGVWATGLTRVGALDVSRLVRVRLHELTESDDVARLAIRWEVAGTGGGLFPALDADLTLLPHGQETTLLTLAGAYRPPLGSLGQVLDRAILHRVAAATVRSFLDRVAVGITSQPGAAEPGTGPSPLPCAPEMS
jgi:hypothetical protein